MARWLRGVTLAVVMCSTVLGAQSAPARIVSTSPSITETLFALGLGERVVGVSIYCRYPESVMALPKVGTYLRPDVELIARLRPDLVFVHSDGGLDRRLGALGIRSSALGNGDTLEHLFTMVRQVASVAGVEERGNALIADRQRRLDVIRTRHRGGEHPRVLFIIGRRPGALADLVAVGPGTYLHELIEIAGGVNVMAIAGQPQYPRISMEAVIRLDPDVIVDTVDMGDTDAERDRRRPVNERLWRAYPNLRAVTRNRVRAATTDALVVPGPRIVEAADWVATQLHGTPPR